MEEKERLERGEPPKEKKEEEEKVETGEKDTAAAATEVKKEDSAQASAVNSSGENLKMSRENSYDRWLMRISDDIGSEPFSSGWSTPSPSWTLGTQGKMHGGVNGRIGKVGTLPPTILVTIPTNGQAGRFCHKMQNSFQPIIVLDLSMGGLSVEVLTFPMSAKPGNQQSK